MSPQLRKVLLLVVLAKIIVLGGIFLSYQWGTFGVEHWATTHTFPDEPISWKTAYQTWDANHILQIAERGYEQGARSNAFLPLFPWMISLLTPLLGSARVAGLLLSNLFSLLGFIFLYKLVEDRFDGAVAGRAVVYALVFPMGFFFTRIYSDSLFFLLGVLFFYSLYRQQFVWASVWALLLPLTRMTGVFVFIPFAVYLWSYRDAARVTGRSWFFVLAPFAGVATLFLFMYWVTGDPFVQFRAQDAWVSAHSLHYFFHIPQWFLDNFIRLDWQMGTGTHNVFDRLMFFVYLILLAGLWGKQDKTLFSYALVMGMVPALSDHFMSYPRYLIVVFPLYIQLALLSVKHRPLQIALFAFQLFFSHMHALHYWVA